MTLPDDDSLLLVLPLRYRRVNGEVLFERQAANGLALWADHFSRVTVAAPVQPESGAGRGDNVSWVPATTIRSRDRIRFVDLPCTYSPGGFARAYKPTSKLLSPEIAKHRYLSFALGGLIGDWGTVACRLAAKMKRPYAVWTDRVEHEVVRRTANTGSFKRKLQARVVWPLMMLAHQRAIGGATLGQFHGRDCLDVYGPWCRRPELVHDIHVSAADRLTAEQVATKRASVLDATRPVRVVYAGRAAAMKGPIDWVAAIAGAISRGANVRATWLGDGPELEAMRAEATRLSVAGRIDFAGFVEDRSRVLAALRDADLLLFAHKTPESPRVLIESLVSGTPIVGYDSAFPKDLIHVHGGGALVPANDVDALATELARLANDRAELATLIEKAWRDSEPFNDVAVFKHRSEMIKQYA